MLALEKTQLWRRTVLAVDVFALLVAAVLAALAAGHGQISTADARLAAIDMSFVLLAMGVRGRRVSQLQGSAIDGFIEALKVCSLGALLALATTAVLGADRPVPIGPELWLLTAVVMCGARLTMQVAQRRARRRGALMTPTLIVGEGLGFARSASSTQTSCRERPTSPWASRCSAALMTSSTCALTPAPAT